MRRRLLLALGLACLAAHASATAARGQTLEDYDYEYLSFRGLGLDAGYIWPDKVEEAMQYRLRLDMGYLGPGVRIIPTLSYWRSEFTTEEIQDFERQLSQRSGVSVGNLGPIQWSDLALSLDGQVVWNAPLRVLTFVGAGLGFHAMNGQGAAIEDTFVEDLLDTITAGVSAMAGFEIATIQRLRLYAEGRYTVMNSIQYLSVQGGLQFMLGESP